jgi:hypothetical protein
MKYVKGILNTGSHFLKEIIVFEKNFNKLYTNLAS